MTISVCGLVCSECEFLGIACQGCKKVKGQTFWAMDHIPEKICPLYNCSVNLKRFNDCGQCDLLPCKMFVQLKDPSITDEDHTQGINKRVEVLRNPT